MKKALFFGIALWYVSILLLLNGCGKTVKIQPAPEYNGWKLPQDVTMRLGKGVAYDIAYSPDGTQLAVASSIGVWLYDANTGVEVALLTGHTEGARSVAFSPDGITLASGDSE